MFKVIVVCEPFLVFFYVIVGKVSWSNLKKYPVLLRVSIRVTPEKLGLCDFGKKLNV